MTDIQSAVEVGVGVGDVSPPGVVVAWFAVGITVALPAGLVEVNGCVVLRGVLAGVLLLFVPDPGTRVGALGIRTPSRLI